MKTAEDIFGKDEDCFGDYQPILDAFGDIVVQVDDKDYTGDSRVLYEYGNGYGWLQFGWGSCSGCDALQACVNVEEVQVLMDELRASIKMFDSAKDALEFFQTHDWRGDYSNGDEQREFVSKVIAYLTDETGGNNAA